MLKIERALRHRRLTMAELLDVTGASIATMKRDLKAMREELDAPLVYDQFDKGYRLTGDWPGVLASAVSKLELD